MSTDQDASGLRRPIWKRWWIWGAVLFVAITIRGALDGTPRPGPPEPPQQATPEPQKSVAPAGPAAAVSTPAGMPKESDARAYTRQVRAELEVTTLEQFTAQMPQSPPPKIVRCGVDRIFAWTFPDGSQITAAFRPRAGEGSGRGLALYMVNVKE
jgi:hypothetical protein